MWCPSPRRVESGAEDLASEVKISEMNVCFNSGCYNKKENQECIEKQPITAYILQNLFLLLLSLDLG